MFHFNFFVAIYVFSLILLLLPGSEECRVIVASGSSHTVKKFECIPFEKCYIFCSVKDPSRTRLIGSGLSWLMDSLLCSTAVVRLDRRRTLIFPSISEAFSQTAKRGLDKKTQLGEKTAAIFIFFSAPRLLSTLKNSSHVLASRFFASLVIESLWSLPSV